MAVNGYELDWDSTIEKDENEFQLIPAGDYDFVVDHIDRTYVGDNSDYKGAKMATVFMNVQIPGQDEVSIRENFILHSNFAWKIGSLLVSTGLKKKGEPITGNYWSKLPGTRGRCQIVQNKAKSGNTYNNVKTFYAPNDQKDSGGNKWAI